MFLLKLPKDPVQLYRLVNIAAKSNIVTSTDIEFSETIIQPFTIAPVIGSNVTLDTQSLRGLNKLFFSIFPSKYQFRIIVNKQLYENELQHPNPLSRHAMIEIVTKTCALKTRGLFIPMIKAQFKSTLPKLILHPLIRKPSKLINVAVSKSTNSTAVKTLVSLFFALIYLIIMTTTDIFFLSSQLKTEVSKGMKTAFKNLEKSNLIVTDISQLHEAVAADKRATDILKLASRSATKFDYAGMYNALKTTVDSYVGSNTETGKNALNIGRNFAKAIKAMLHQQGAI